MKIETIHREPDGTWSGKYADHSVTFSADPALFLIREAWHRGLSLERWADGFGYGAGTHGDWSAIRDSSDDAKDAMLLAALKFFKLDGGL